MDDINLTTSGGVLDVSLRRLQTYTIQRHGNGTFMVMDDRQNGRLAGAGFPTIEAAVKAYERADYRRIWGV